MKSKKTSLKILITTGPTREFIDPIRFISNSSTGTIGYLLAKTAKRLGHKVVLLSGPSDFKPISGIKTVGFTSATDLKKEVDNHFEWADCIICAAAVSDFRPTNIIKSKIKKEQGLDIIKLKKNPDILKSLGKKKRSRILVGFALESDDLLKNAKKKLKSKNLDFIVANKISSKRNPFGSGDTNVSIIDSQNVQQFEHISKVKLARIILDRVLAL